MSDAEESAVGVCMEEALSAAISANFLVVAPAMTAQQERLVYWTKANA